LDIHAKEARVKIDAPVEVANQHHGVPNPKGNAIDGFFAAHSFPLCINPYSAVKPKMPEARCNPRAVKASGCEISKSFCALARRCYEA
jgi:hypothetical protein